MRYLIIGISVLSFSCSSKGIQEPDHPVPGLIKTIGNGLDRQSVYRFCDENNLVYVYNGYKQGGIFVVKDGCNYVLPEMK